MAEWPSICSSVHPSLGLGMRAESHLALRAHIHSSIWIFMTQGKAVNVQSSAKRRFSFFPRLRDSPLRLDAGSHNLLSKCDFPFFSPEEEHEGLEEVAEVVVALEGGARVELDVAEELHADDGVDEEQHEHEQPDVRQGLQ